MLRPAYCPLNERVKVFRQSAHALHGSSPTSLQKNTKRPSNGHAAHLTIFTSLVGPVDEEKAAERHPHPFLPVTSSISSWGRSSSQGVLDLLRDLLSVRRVGNTSRGRQPGGGFARCPRHLSRLLLSEREQPPTPWFSRMESSRLRYEESDNPSSRHLVPTRPVISFFQALQGWIRN